MTDHMTRSDLIRLRDAIEAGELIAGLAERLLGAEAERLLMNAVLVPPPHNVGYAIAFTEAVLPDGWRWQVMRSPEKQAHAMVWPQLGLETFASPGATPATALVLAALTALIERTPE